MAKAIRPIWLGPLALVIASCSPMPSPSVSASPAASNLVDLPAGQPVRIDEGVEMSTDNRVVTLRFIGGPILPATDPCFTDYWGSARPTGDVLEVAVVKLESKPIDVSAPVACPGIGAARFVEVTLDQPFLGVIAHDVPFATDIPIERPAQ